MIAIRGATTILSNTKEEIKKESIRLIEQIIRDNNLNKEKIISIFFSCTKDINKAYPGKYVREDLNLSNVAIMHFNEMDLDAPTLDLCIRVTLFYDGHVDNLRFVYLNKAVNLRKDLMKKI